MKFKVNNEEVFASTGGRPFDKNKPLIIFIHGSGLTHMCWVLQTRYFAFHGYSVLALDLPGHGLSGGKSLTSVEKMADWINDVIDAVGFNQASLVGHSQGCLVAVECASRYSSKIQTLSLSKEIKDTLGVDFRACENYSNGFEAAKKLDLPTLSILADKDRMCRLKDGQKLADHIKGSEVHVIKNCGHMMLLEEADQTLAILKKFILDKYPIT